MSAPFTIFASTALAATCRGLYGKYREWKLFRNSLDDDVRETLFWNDRNYERLEMGITALLWSPVVLIPLWLLWTYGGIVGWW